MWLDSGAEAVARMRFALENFVVLGVTTNIEFLRGVIEHPAFVAADLSTRFLEEHEIAPPAEAGPEALMVAALESAVSAPPATVAPGAITPWDSGGAWRIVK